jgi:hypothetical protein
LNHPYQVLGASIPVLLGRRRLIEQLERHLLKPSPDHVQVVGPTLFGKSVFLSGLAERLRGGATFIATAYADLRHAPPSDDASLRRRFAEVVKKALAEANASEADYIDINDERLHEWLDLAFQDLERRQARLLVILDGFDHVLAGVGITRNLWDQLRSLAQRSSLRLVTGSRRPLRELCRTEESRTSDFWEIFYPNPVVIGSFGPEDWDELLAPFSTNGIELEGAARTELLNWSGGVPVLSAGLLALLGNGASTGVRISKASVDAVAAEVLAQPPPYLEELWDDCDQDLRADVASLAAAEGQGVAMADLSALRQRALVQRGYGVAAGNRIRAGCRLMSRYAAQQGPAVADLQRLFRKGEDFDRNIRGLLELRLANVASQNADDALVAYLQSAIRDLDSSPELSLKLVRSIASRAMAIIWDLELEPGRRIPEAWIQSWQHSGEQLKWLTAERGLPKSDGAKCNVLRLMTGTEKVARTAKVASKVTSLLVDALQSVGDFGQHREDFPESVVSKTFASSVLMAAIELTASLAADVNRVKNEQRDLT